MSLANQGDTCKLYITEVNYFGRNKKGNQNIKKLMVIFSLRMFGMNKVIKSKW